MRGSEELIDQVVKAAGLPSGKRRSEVRRELRAHMEDLVAAAGDSGRSEAEIEKLVLDHFGDPEQIARSFAWVYRQERRRLRACAFALWTVALAGLLLVAALALQAGLAMAFGTSMVKVLASRHTAIEALDVLSSVAVYLGIGFLEGMFISRKFGKAAAVIAIVVAFATAALPGDYLIYGLVNGIFLRVVRQLVVSRTARAGIVAICFPLAGLALAWQRAPVTGMGAAQTCASWLVMGAGYLAMTGVAGRIIREFKEEEVERA
jgi:hypothetical protein